MSEELHKDQSITDVEKQESIISENSKRHAKYRGSECLNCGQPLDLSDRYCPYCSQLNSTKHLSFKDFFLEFFSSLVSYDSKLRYTVKDLLFKPGTITRNYIRGQRMKYSNPFRFFLSVSIIYFLLSSIVNFFSPSPKIPIFNNGNDAESELSVNNDVSSITFENTRDKEIEEAIQTLEANPTTKRLAVRLKREDSIRRAKISKEDKTIRIFNGDTIFENNYSGRVKQLGEKGTIQGFFLKAVLLRDFYTKTEIKSASIALDSLKLPKSKTNVWLYHKNKSVDRVQEDPVSFAQFVLSKTPFFLFFFAPIFALIFWLLYLRRPFNYMEHLVFIFHIFSFIFLSLLILSIPELIFGVEIFVEIFFLFVGPFYFYKALRNFYKQSRSKTILKFVLLNIIFTISVTTAATLFFAATAATY